MEKKKQKYAGDPPKGVSLPAHHVKGLAKAANETRKKQHKRSPREDVN
jgi:hypothetical protein